VAKSVPQSARLGGDSSSPSDLLRMTYELGYVCLVEATVVHWTCCKKESHLNRHGVVGEHEAGGGGGDGEDLGGAAVTVAEADGGVEGVGLNAV